MKRTSVSRLILLLIIILFGGTQILCKKSSPEINLRSAEELQGCELAPGSEVIKGYDPEPPPQWSDDFKETGVYNRQKVLFYYSKGVAETIESARVQAEMNAKTEASNAVNSLITQQVYSIIEEMDVEDSEAVQNIIQVISGNRLIKEEINQENLMYSGSFYTFYSEVLEVDPINCVVLLERERVKCILRGALLYENYKELRARLLEESSTLLSEEEQLILDNTRNLLPEKDEQLWQ